LRDAKKRRLNLAKIIGSITAASSLQITDKDAQYDAASKEILSNKEFLAIILKHTVKEFADMDYQAIANCIEADSISRTTEVTEGRTDQNRISGVNTEFIVLGEKTSHLDVLFKAVNPRLSNEKITCFLFVNVEANKDFKPGYPIEKRGICYMSRMIGSQLSVLTEETDYGAIQKVYSIWICEDNIPKELQNTVSVYEFVNTWNNKEINLTSDNHDLMSMIIIRLGNPEEDSDEDIIRFMNSLFYPRNEKSYEILNEYVDFSDVLKTEVKKTMSILERNYVMGVEKGKAEGRAEGEIKGETELPPTKVGGLAHKCATTESRCKGLIPLKGHLLKAS
jgi:hypothetical protein